MDSKFQHKVFETPEDANKVAETKRALYRSVIVRKSKNGWYILTSSGRICNHGYAEFDTKRMPKL